MNATSEDSLQQDSHKARVTITFYDNAPEEVELSEFFSGALVNRVGAAVQKAYQQRVTKQLVLRNRARVTEDMKAEREKKEKEKKDEIAFIKQSMLNSEERLDELDPKRVKERDQALEKSNITEALQKLREGASEVTIEKREEI
jgi:hypothetical protein